MTPKAFQKEMDEVKQAILDYVEGAYQADPARIERSVHADLAKIGFVGDGSRYTAYRETREELLGIASTFNLDGHISKDARKEITVFDVLDQTASAKLEAWWGVDFLHLMKQDGKWVIINVLWQTTAETAGRL